MVFAPAAPKADTLATGLASAAVANALGNRKEIGATLPPALDTAVPIVTFCKSENGEIDNSRRSSSSSHARRVGRCDRLRPERRAAEGWPAIR
jgi:hypothetical protein